MAVGLLLTLFGVVTLGFFLSVPQMLQELPRPDSYDAQQKFYSDFRRQVIKTSPVDVNPVLPENAENSQLFIQVRVCCSVIEKRASVLKSDTARPPMRR